MAFLILPGSSGLADLLPIVGAYQMVVEGTWAEVKKAIEEAGPTPAIKVVKKWQVWSLANPDEDALALLSEALEEELQQDGKALVELDVKVASVTDIQTIAANLGVSLSLVAILEPENGGPPPLQNDLHLAIIEALRSFSKPASTGQLCSLVGVPAHTLKRHLAILIRYGRIVKRGRRNGIRYSLAEETIDDPE